MTVFRLNEDSLEFPPPQMAEPNGLLAVGGDLRPERLLLAYRMGIFPWYSQGDPLLWWSPDPRLILFPNKLHVSKRLRRTINSHTFTITMDTAFAEIIRLCASIHARNHGATWISDEMITAYCRLHEMGWAHSVETRQDGALVGGLYGLAIGKCFFGESMFSRVSNASKVALAHLAELLQNNGFTMIDCQVTTPHLQRLGGVEVPRHVFIQKLSKGVHSSGHANKRHFTGTTRPSQSASRNYRQAAKTPVPYGI